MLKKKQADLEVSCNPGPHGLNPFFITVPGFLVDGKRIKGARFGVHRPFTIGTGYAKPVMHDDLGWVVVEISSGRRVSDEPPPISERKLSIEAALDKAETRCLKEGGGPGLKAFWDQVKFCAHDRYLTTKKPGLKFKPKPKLRFKQPEPASKPVLKLKLKSHSLQGLKLKRKI